MRIKNVRYAIIYENINRLPAINRYNHMLYFSLGNVLLESQQL